MKIEGDKPTISVDPTPKILASDVKDSISKEASELEKKLLEDEKKKNEKEEKAEKEKRDLNVIKSIASQFRADRKSEFLTKEQSAELLKQVNSSQLKTGPIFFDKYYDEALPGRVLITVEYMEGLEMNESEKINQILTRKKNPAGTLASYKIANILAIMYYNLRKSEKSKK